MRNVNRSVVAYVVMGICGCGKSTVAQDFANHFSIEMLDADDFHPQENVDKMAAGTPLNDDDRAGWLVTLNAELSKRLNTGVSVVLACSALKQRYRDAIGEGLATCQWVYLKGSRELIVERMAKRVDHYMPASLIDSQLATLEEPVDAVVVDIVNTPEAIQRQLVGVFG